MRACACACVSVKERGGKGWSVYGCVKEGEGGVERVWVCERGGGGGACAGV